MNKVFALIFLFLVSLSAMGEQLLFAPVIIEEQKERIVSEQLKIAPHSGIGAINHLIPTNQFGIEITTLEKDTDISNLRRNQFFHFDKTFKNKKKATLMQLELGNTQSMSLKTKNRYQLNVTAKRDYQSYSFTDNNNTPFTQGDDFKNSYQKKEEHYFLGIQKGLFVSEIDQHKNNVIAATKLAGYSETNRFEANLGYKYGKLSNTLFGSYQQKDFESYNPNLFNTTTKISRAILHGNLKLPMNITTTYSLGYETWQRSFDLLSGSTFSRGHLKAKLLHHWSSSRWVETKTIVSSEIIRDPGNLKPLIDIKEEITSSSQYPFGLLFSINYYQRAPTPSQFFGDGALLAANPDLKAEQGVRTQFGPWLKTKSFEGKIQFFAEESKNSPIQVGLTQSRAKTRAIDGVWTRGGLIKNRFKSKYVLLDFEYQFQEALNNSEINWQRGNPIPERPRHFFRSGIEFFFDRIRIGTNLTIEKGKYRDLAGMDLAPSTYSSNYFICYTQKKYRLNLQLNNIFLSKSWKEVRSFQDSAGPNILEPLLKQPEVKLTWEYLI